MEKHIDKQKNSLGRKRKREGLREGEGESSIEKEKEDKVRKKKRQQEKKCGQNCKKCSQQKSLGGIIEPEIGRNLVDKS